VVVDADQDQVVGLHPAEGTEAHRAAAGPTVRSRALAVPHVSPGRIAALILLCALALAGCGDDGRRPDDDAIEAAVAERHGADHDQAVCLREYLVADYDADELEVLVDEGVGALPQARWDPYLLASVACLTQPLDDR
jgi:hypothetical protein